MKRAQKFKRGDYVMIADDLGPMKSHFESGCEAIVIGSYADQYAGDDTKSYTLYLRNSGKSSWYGEHELTLIEKNRLDILDQWEKDRN